MRVLAVGAHFDDVELGCGGAVARHVADGDDVTIYCATRSGYSNAGGAVARDNDVALEEGREAARRLSCKLVVGDFPTFEVEFNEALNRALRGLIEKLEPDLVYTHWLHDIHHDHQVIARSSLHCARHVRRVLMYRSNWYETTEPFVGNFYVDITEHWQTKAYAIHAHETEFARGVGGRWLAFWDNAALNAGQRIGVERAEVFQVVKWLV